MRSAPTKPSHESYSPDANPRMLLDPVIVVPVVVVVFVVVVVVLVVVVVAPPVVRHWEYLFLENKTPSE